METDLNLQLFLIASPLAQRLVLPQDAIAETSKRQRALSTLSISLSYLKEVAATVTYYSISVNPYHEM